MSSQFANLDNLVDKTTVECLNEDSRYPVKNCLFQPNLDLETRSLDDHELLIKFGFSCPVKIGQFQLQVSKAVAEEGSFPSEIYLYVNQPSLDFSNYDDHQAKEILTLTKEDVREGKKIDLRIAKFQNVRNFALLVSRNAADVDITRIGYLGLHGYPESSLDMKSWKPVEEPQE